MRESRFESRELLLEAALNVFGDMDYDKASLNQILKKATISKGTFYYHFKNKEELYLQLLKTSHEAKWLFINKYTEENSADFSTMDIFDKFLFQAKGGLLFAHEYPEYNQLANMFIKEKGNPIYDVVVGEIGSMSSEMLSHMIEEAYVNGELDTSYSLEFIKQVLEKLFTSYDDIFNQSIDLERSFTNLNDFVSFMKNGFKA